MIVNSDNFNKKIFGCYSLLENLKKFTDFLVFFQSFDKVMMRLVWKPYKNVSYAGTIIEVNRKRGVNM